MKSWLRCGFETGCDLLDRPNTGIQEASCFYAGFRILPERQNFAMGLEFCLKDKILLHTL